MPRKFEQSRKLQKRAERYIPGGVNSPVRSFRAVGGDPPFLVRGAGSRVWDADGNEYIDYIGSWGPLVLGHAEPKVVEAVTAAAKNGMSFGASTSMEADLAELVISAFPAIEMLRFVSSGTEATMSAIRLARASTKRKYIIKFEGCYHGHADALLVKAGSGVTTLGIPGSAGVPEEFAQFTLALPFNNTDAVEHAFSKYKHQIACVIVEPVVGNMGCVPGSGGYLAALRLITQREKAVLIFDEVMTGFRVAFGGAQELYGIRPDLTTLGKIIGGGLAVAAFGGRGDVMELLDPRRRTNIPQGGTYNGNPLGMAAGLAAMTELTPDVYDDLNRKGERVCDQLAEVFASHDVAVQVNGAGSMFALHFTATPVTDYRTMAAANKKRTRELFLGLVNHGVLMAPRAMGALSTPMEEDDIQRFIDAVDVVVAEQRPRWEAEG